MSKNIFNISFLFLLIFTTHSVLGQNTKVYMQDGLQKYQNGDYRGAITSFQKVAKINPDHPEVYEYAGNAYFILEEYALAEKVYTIALEKAYLQSFNSNNNGSYKQGNISIIAPNLNTSSYTANVAMIYNNRGATRLARGNKKGALRDFQEALKLDNDLAITKQNLQTLQGGNYEGGGTFFFDDPGRGNSNQRIDRDQNVRLGQEPNYLGIRPGNINKQVDIRQSKLEAIEFRENRQKFQSDNSSFFSGIFNNKSFERRRVPRKGKLYKNPPVGASSRNYVTIESVRITQSSTYVNFKVVNRRPNPYFVSLAPSDVPEFRFMITDRMGSSDKTFQMLDVSGIELHPNTSRLDPETAILFTVEFPKIPDTMGYINIIEGTKQTGEEWNFYNVDLTE